jgi:hypothetical protein
MFLRMRLTPNVVVDDTCRVPRAAVAEPPRSSPVMLRDI